LLFAASDVGYEFGLLRGVREVNAQQHERMVDKIRTAAGGSLSGRTVGVLGLTFKANTDDLRDSPAVVIVNRLIDEGATVRAYDPAAGDRGSSINASLEVRPDAYEAATGAHVLAVLTEWDEFRWLDFVRIRESMASPSLVDARNLLDPATMRRRGFFYVGVGR
jgi:UDPglucose 6-dehydrogenase